MTAKSKQRKAAATDALGCGVFNSGGDEESQMSNLMPQDGTQHESTTKRKKSHSAVEKRRRIRMAKHIDELGACLSYITKDKVDKLTVLRKGCDEVRKLRGFPPGGPERNAAGVCKHQVKATQQILPDEDVMDLIEKGTNGCAVTIDCQKGTITSLSENVTKFLPYQAIQLKGVDLKELVHPDDVEKLVGVLAQPSVADLVESARKELVVPEETEGDVLPFSAHERLATAFFMRVRLPDLVFPWLSSTSVDKHGKPISDDGYSLCKFQGSFRGKFPSTLDASEINEESCSGWELNCIMDECDLPMWCAQKECKQSDMAATGLSCSCRVNLSGDITHCDDQWESVLGIDHRVLKNLPFWRLVCADDEAHLRQTWDNTLRAMKGNDTAVVRLRIGQHRMQWVACVFYPINNCWIKKPEFGLMTITPLLNAATYNPEMFAHSSVAEVAMTTSSAEEEEDLASKLGEAVKVLYTSTSPSTDTAPQALAASRSGPALGPTDYDGLYNVVNHSKASACSSPASLAASFSAGVAASASMARGAGEDAAPVNHTGHLQPQVHSEVSVQAALAHHLALAYQCPIPVSSAAMASLENDAAAALFANYKQPYLPPPPLSTSKAQSDMTAYYRSAAAAGPPLLLPALTVASSHAALQGAFPAGPHFSKIDAGLLEVSPQLVAISGHGACYAAAEPVQQRSTPLSRP
eukprot:scpid34984/ scgid21372/ Aryl hydrocarbon receptor nuclear translocator-like protein 2; Brain and muscle ARNT-like 2